VTLLVSVRLVIYRSWVQILAVHYCVVVLDKLLTPVCLSQQAVWFGIGQRVWSLWLGK